MDLFSIFFVDATFSENELMEYEHYTRDGVRHTQVVTRTLRPTRDIQLADVRELFTTHLQTILPRDTMHYAFELQKFFNMSYLGNGSRLEHTSAGPKIMKLRLISNGTTFNDLGQPTNKYTKFLSRDAMLCDGPALLCPSG